MKSLPEATPIKTVAGCCPDNIPADVLASPVPLVLKGLIKDWPVVGAASCSLTSAATYLSTFWNDLPVTAYVTDAGSESRLFYNEDFTGFNFKRGVAPLHQVFKKLSEHSADTTPPVIYVGSSMVDKFLPGFRDANDLNLAGLNPMVSMWVGNRSRVSAHFDFPDNIACVVAGRRRFTLFPPNQIKNLYIGPIDITPAGQSISMVDFHSPDLDRFPLFADAMLEAQVAELEPGDALFIPSMWWHHVESLSVFNILVNYWWITSPAFMAAPSSALLNAILAFRDLPEHKKKAWKGLLDHYVFNTSEDVYKHIPAPGRGVLAEFNEVNAAKMRAEIMNKLK